MRLVGHPHADQIERIAASKPDFERRLRYPVKHFAYPYVRADDLDATSIDAVRKARFESPCSSIPGRVHPDTDSLELPHPIVMDWGRPRFRARMPRWGNAVTR